jgi:hypothetical protein
MSPPPRPFLHWNVRPRLDLTIRPPSTLPTIHTRIHSAFAECKNRWMLGFQDGRLGLGSRENLTEDVGDFVSHASIHLAEGRQIDTGRRQSGAYRTSTSKPTIGWHRRQTMEERPQIDVSFSARRDQSGTHLARDQHAREPHHGFATRRHRRRKLDARQVRERGFVCGVYFAPHRDEFAHAL